jgi:signal transduction histidine kinase
MPMFTPVIPTITLAVQLIVEYGTLTKRRSLAAHLATRAASVAFVYGGYFLLRDLGVRSYFAYYLLNVAYLGACLFLFSESAAQKVYLFFASWGVTTFLSSLCGWSSQWLARGGSGASVVRYGLYLGSYLLILPFYMRHWRGHVKSMLSLFAKANPAYAVYPFLAFVLFSALFGPASAPAPLPRFFVMLFFEALIVFSYWLLFSQAHAAVDRAQAELMLRDAERQVLLQRRYYAEVELGVRRQRELIHDMRHHLVALAALAESGDRAAIGDYLRPLLERYGAPGPARYCENKAVNAILGGYIAMAEEKGIAVSVELDLPAAIGIDEYDLCTLFGNAIENAIEGCERIAPGSELASSKYISLKSRSGSGRLVARIENSCSPSLRKEGEGFSSSKGSLGGVGISSMRSVVERHRGYLGLEQRGSLFVLSAVLYQDEAAQSAPSR